MSRFSIRYPYLIVVICLIVCVVGVTSLLRMPVDLFPPINIPVVVVASLLYLFIAERGKNDKGAFVASCGYIVGMLVGAAFALYPVVLPASTDPNYSLTIYNTATGAHGMAVGLVWWGMGMVLATIYFVFVYRMFRGKVRVEEGASGHGY